MERPAGAELTPADVPLIDELAELLGPSQDAQSHRARLEAQRREELVSYAAQAIEAQNLGEGMVDAEMLADRVEDSGPSLTLAERARADRTWTYGHIVVDEAQELGDMAWRALARRCPVRSFTVVGDLAQYSGPNAPRSWTDVLASLGTRARTGAASTPVRQEALTVCYRTPATIMEAAEDVATALGQPPVFPVRSVRDLEDCLVIDAPLDAGDAQGEDAWGQVLRTAVRQESDALDGLVGRDGGRIAVITPHPEQDAALLKENPTLLQALTAPGGDVLRSRLAVMSPRLSKGLEFDVVVLADPAVIGEASPGDLYVAMTRPTRRLRVISRTPLPEGLRRP